MLSIHGSVNAAPQTPCRNVLLEVVFISVCGLGVSGSFARKRASRGFVFRIRLAQKRLTLNHCFQQALHSITMGDRGFHHAVQSDPIGGTQFAGKSEGKQMPGKRLG